ncbi:MAG TPA: HAD-IA family hydrolase [Hyphomicrobiaceae bacterium]|nr:HAD-IA family hydrolase [Hyphomicrobiaceae bacterium]
MKLVIFDCDGTLIDSQHLIFAAMHRTFARHGLPPPDQAAVRSVVGLSLPIAIGKLLPPGAESRIEKLTDTYRTTYGELRADPVHAEPLFPGARETVAALHARPDVVLGIATGKSRRGVTHVLAMHGLDHYFTTVQTADIHPSKPHPAMIEYAMLEAGVGAQDTAMVGDTSYDMIMAAAAGVVAVGAGWGYHSPADLETAGAMAVVPDFPSLGAALNRLLFERKEAP